MPKVRKFIAIEQIFLKICDSLQISKKAHLFYVCLFRNLIGDHGIKLG